MDLTRLAVDAGQFINRAVQYTEESLGHAEKTDLQPGLEELFARADATKTWSDQIISQTEVLLQPNSGARMEDRLYEHLDWSVPPRPRAHEVLGDQMVQAGLEMGSNTPYGTALLRCGEAQKQLGEAERKFVQSTNIHFLTPLRSFTEGEYGAMQDERKMLVNKRLDLDIAKTRVRKAHEAEREGRSLNANPLEDDYLSHVSYMFSFLRVKWLKMWAQEIAQAEMEQRICQSLFDRQSEITRQVVEGIGNTHTNHMRSLTDFVEGQACYFHQCHQLAQELQQQLSSIPAVLCSNNWQSAIRTNVNRPTVSDRVADPVADPVPVVVHQIPDFDQDLWTSSDPIAATEKNPDSSVTSQPINNNNNNNNCFSEEQLTSHSGEISALGRTASAQTNGATSAMTNQTTTTTKTTTSPPSELSGVESQRANAGAGGAGAGGAVASANAAVEALKTWPPSPKPTNDVTRESSSAANQDGVQ
ncbi:endophilin-B1-like [Clinocottus analis]|uniref:endophilin-B1-like n=1 Tax=Clinocottus analis TaxID=304258 RepID=UPI0035BEEFD2